MRRDAWAIAVIVMLTGHRFGGPNVSLGGSDLTWEGGSFIPDILERSRFVNDWVWLVLRRRKAYQRKSQLDTNHKRSLLNPRNASVLAARLHRRPVRLSTPCASEVREALVQQQAGLLRRLHLRL